MPTHAISVDGSLPDPTTGEVLTTLQQALQEGNAINTLEGDMTFSSGNPDYSGVISQLYYSNDKVELMSQSSPDDQFFVVADNQNTSVQLMARSSTSFNKVKLSADTFTISKNLGLDRPIIFVDVSDDFADDTAAAAGGIEVGQVYHSAGVLKIRLA